MNLEIGKKLIQNKDYINAKKFFLAELEKGNKSSRLFFFLGFVFFELNDILKSITYYNKALKLDPNSINIILNLANAQYTVGNFETAKKLFLKIIKLDKNNLRAFYGMSLISSDIFNNNDFLNYIKNYQKKELNLHEKSLLNYLLSKKAKNEKILNLELVYLKRHHDYCFESNQNFNQQGLFYYDKIISKNFNSVTFYNDDVKYQEDFFKKICPIFIIGLPRSGSTLIETLISSSSSKIVSLGETSIINSSIINQIKYEIFQKNFNNKKFKFKIDINCLKKEVFSKYECFLEKNQSDKVIIIDKSLENFFNVEIILKLFPNAKFVHGKRNLRDSIVAIYQAMLPTLPWSHSILNILKYIDNYIKIVEYFSNRYPDKVLTIDLKDLTNDKFNYSKKILSFCDLEWSKNILEFNKRKSLYIKTLSNSQIRDGIIKYDDKKYTNYENLYSNFFKIYNWLNV